MRPSKDKYYLDIAKQVAQRSTCFRVKIGAVIVRGDQIVSTGYVGAPRKTKDCLERGNCLRNILNIPHGQRYELCRSIHAEQNSIVNAARAGVSIFGGNMYLYGEDKEGKTIDVSPCFICKKMIINSGIEKVICSRKDEDFIVFDVEKWISDWQEKDIIDDKDQYGKDEKK